MTHIHEYYGGVCLCGKKQPTIRNGKEVSQNINFDRKIAYKPPQARRKRINSEFQSVVDEVMVYLHEDVYKKGNFSKYCGIVKRIGTTKARQWIKEMRGRGITNPRYFMKIYGNFNQANKTK